MTDPIVLGADIGGSHITTALVNSNVRAIIPGSRHRVYVNAHDPAAAIIACWAGCMQNSLQSAHGVKQIGIAMPGPFDYEAGISQIKGLHKYDALYGLNIKELLASSLQIEAGNIKMANDASCFLQGELICGAARGLDAVTGLSLGTGFGSATALNGRVQDASFFEMPFGASVAEDYFSSRWFTKRYQELSGLQPAGNVKEIAAVAADNSAATDLFHEFGSNLALFLSSLQPVPEMVLLGGNIARTFHLFGPALRERLASQHLPVDFILSVLGEDAALLGAAALL